MTANEKMNSFDIGDNVVPNATNTATTGSAVTIGTPTGTPNVRMLTVAGLTGQGMSVTSTTNTDVYPVQFIQGTGSADFVAIYAVEINAARRPLGSLHTFMRFRSASTNVLKAVAGTNGSIAIQTGAGAGVYTFAPNANVVLPDGWYHVSILGRVNTTTGTAGTVTAHLYRASDAVLLDSFTSNSINLGTLTVTTMVMGKPEAGAAGSTLPNGFYTDNPKFDIGTTTMYVPTAVGDSVNTLQQRLTAFATAVGVDIKTIGVLSGLTTSVKTSIVAALNELNAKFGTYPTLPANTTLVITKNGATWPGVPTTRTDIPIIWKGADPSPPIVATRTLNSAGMLDGVDFRVVI